MVLTGWRLVHVPGRVAEPYSYRRRFTIKDDKPKKPKKAAKVKKAPGKRMKKPKMAPSTGKMFVPF